MRKEIKVTIYNMREFDKSLLREAIKVVEGKEEFIPLEELLKKKKQ